MTEKKLSKAERLVIAGYVAPRLRSTDVRVKSRKVGRLDAEGNVVGYTTLAKVQEALLLEREIELATQEGVRPKEVLCENCGRLVRVLRGKPSKTCRDGCGLRCAMPDCGKLVAQTTAFTYVRLKLRGRTTDRLGNIVTPPVCNACRPRKQRSPMPAHRCSPNETDASKAKVHGRRSLYQRGCRCDECREANNRYTLKYMARARVKKRFRSLFTPGERIED